MKIIIKISANNNSEIKIAKHRIHLAKRTNRNYVKFRKKDLNICIPHNKKNEIRETP